jgi:membrane protein DedA with SNARE-associated domain
MSTARFIAWDVLGLCITAPLYLGLGYAFSKHLDDIRAGVVRIEHVGVFALVAAVAVYGTVVVVRGLRRDHRGGPPPAEGHDDRR